MELLSRSSSPSPRTPSLLAIRSLSNPGEERAASVASLIFSESSYATPQRRTVAYAVGPATHSPDIIPFPIESQLPLSFEPKDKEKTPVSYTGSYRLGEKSLPCIQQPPQRSSCGTAALLMLIAPFLREGTLSDDFWRWYGSTGLTNADDLKERVHAENLEIQTRAIFFHTSSIIERMKGEAHAYDHLVSIASRIEVFDHLIRPNRLPCIVSITHPVLHGHWILIDSIDRESSMVFIRDPYSGKAYRLSIPNFLENWPESDEVKVIYLERK